MNTYSGTSSDRTRQYVEQPHATPTKHSQRSEEPTKTRTTNRILGDYTLSKTLGSGSMGKVKLAHHNITGEKLAVKILPRVVPVQLVPGSPNAEAVAKQATKDASKEIRTIREAALSQLLYHPYICGMREMIVHQHHYYMVFEYIDGGQMLDYIISHGRLRERVARKFARQIGSALEYCHKNNVVHRGLKIEDILISQTGNIKIIDFGLSNLYDPVGHLSTFCGSLYFAAPELLNAKVYTGPEVDLWSFGVVLYVLVCGKVPFDDQSMPALHAKIKRGLVEYPVWLSSECKHILSRMLVANPQQRASLPDLLNHPWMTRGFNGPPDPHLLRRDPLHPDQLERQVIRGMTGFEFGTEEEIEERLVAILNSDAYKRAIKNWESKRERPQIWNGSLFNPSLAISWDNGAGGQGGGNKSETTTPKKNKRFSGFDFYRRKLFSPSSSPPPPPFASSSASQSQLSLSDFNSKEPPDPTRGYHQLISMYYLAREKLERDRVYGPGHFASSQLSLLPLQPPPEEVQPAPSTFSKPTPLVGPPPVVTPQKVVGGADYSMRPSRLPAPESPGRLRSLDERESTAGASPRLPTVSLGAAAPATSAPTQFSFATPTPSLPLTSPECVGDQNADGDGAIAPSSTWWNNLKRKRMNPIEQAEGYARTRSRAIEAIGGALGMAANIGHEVLFTGVDLLKFVPVPGLDTAGKILLSIWDAVDMVETNRRASLRLIERCAEILISIREELIDAGYSVVEELGAPMEKLVKAFEEVRSCLQKLGHCPFLERYLKRDEILSSISACNIALNDSLDKFKAAVSIRILKFTIANEQGQKEILDALSYISPSLLPARLPSSSEALQLLPAETQRLHSTLHALCAKQNAHDRALDMADLHRLMLTALSVNDDIAMIEVLQIARKNMPDAIRALERALKRLIEGGHLDAEDSTAVLPSSQEAGDSSGASLDPGNTGASPSSANTLDRKFMVAGLDALQRLSKSTDLGLPSWTITQLEIDFWEKVGFGSFSEVFRGTWRKHTVAVKVLDKTTPRKTFLKEVELWKTLHHPNVVELFGASSASCETPWFLVCKYYPRGNLVRYLKGLSETDAACVDAAKMIYEISKGMAYLHEQDVLHGDLKAANILVDDDSSCVVSDFGQSEMRSEVYRLTLAPQQPRGTFRWQAPELMEGAQKLTPEMDVYAFAICCWEILNMGALPWRFTEDSTVRHLVLNKNMRPELPPSNLMSGHLTNVIHVILLSWDRVPSKRPSFEQIVHQLKKQRAGAERR